MGKLGISGSGTSTKIQFSLGVAHKLHELGVLPDVFNGCSGQSIINLFWASRNFSTEVIDMFMEVSAKDIFNKAPMNNKGKITFNGILRALTGETSLGEQENLRKLIKKYFRRTHFYDILKEGVEVFTTQVSYNRKRTFYKKLDGYEQAISNVMASSAIPLAVQPENQNGELFYDGGVLDHNGGKQLARRKDIDVLITIWSRPNYLPKIRRMEELEREGKTNTDEYLKLNDFEEWEPKNILDVDFRTHAVRTFGLSVEDEEYIDLLCEKNGIKQIKIFPDYVLMEETYKFDPDLNRSMYHHGTEKAKEIFEIYRDSLVQ